MTVAVLVKVYDGVVLATDSATSGTAPGGDKQVYNGADKAFQLHRDRPIGAMTWGKGQVGPANIATLVKDLRGRLMGDDEAHAGWALNDSYTVEQVMGRLIEMIHGELFVNLPPDQHGDLGFLVAGYNGDGSGPEAWKVILSDATTPTPELEADAAKTGWWAYAQPQPVTRLFDGMDDGTRDTLLGILPEPVKSAVATYLDSAKVQPAQAPMPLTDAIDLARFMVDTTIGFRTFSFGANTVGGPVEVAAISRHEGFKWIARKHYYPAHLNPKDPHPT